MKTLIFILVLCSTNLFAYQVYFSPQDNLIQVLLKHLDGAKQNIDMSIYTFNSELIRSKLIQKVQENVKVRVVIHKGSNSRVQRFIAPLVKAGAKIRYVSKINHHKFVVVDQESLYSSSGNVSDSSRQASYDENSIICSKDCPKLVAAYHDEFEFLYTHSKSVVDHQYFTDATLYPKKISEDVLFTTTNFNPKWRRGKISFQKSPERPSGNVASALVDVIDSAQGSIQVATGHFRSWPLYKALARASKRGVKVEVIMDSQEYISSYGQKFEDQKVEKCINAGKSEEQCSQSGVHFSRKLSQSGVMAYFKYYAIRWFFPKAPQMHSKYMIVDGKTLYTGSYNWSYNAEFNTFENVAIIRNQKTVKKYQKNFQYLKNLRHQQVGKFMETINSAKQKLPLVFNPMALTVSQVDKIVNTYKEKCPDLYNNSLGADSCIIKN